MELPIHVVRLLNRSDITKVLGVHKRDGTLDLVPLATIKAPKPDLILLPQDREREAHDDLTEAMERHQSVSILCLAHLQDERQAYQITCVVREYQTAGPLYEKFLDELRASYAELQGIWILEPLSIKAYY
ncbi:MAG: hypothetical protein LUP95_02730 [Euryarchaeota archaeon]|nr:hypothetical protein [Euryarchaeota archaeon]